MKRYTKQTLTEINGPVTVIAGKNIRITFIECSNDMNAMIDIAKVADLVLMTIDASYGFEMETFEFLNILQAHGFPRIMGVLTHLDSPKFSIKNGGTKKLRKVKKKLKHRFWTEIYQGAKLFYLSGIINGRYPNNEILNLSRFISVMKFRPLVWKNSHPYLLCDRFEDLTPEEEVRQSKDKCDRTVSFYGYVRGTNLKQGSKIHLAGVGDFDVADVSTFEDPCPLPSSEKKIKRLDEKQKLLYAPMCDVGGILYDKDAVYINVPGKYNKETNSSDGEVVLGEGDKMVLDLQDVDGTLKEGLEKSELTLFSGSKAIMAKNVPKEITELDETSGRIRRRAGFDYDNEEDEDLSGSDDDDEEEDCNSEQEGGRYENDGEQGKEDYAFADSDSEFELSENEESDLKWKGSLVEKALVNFKKGKVRLMDLIYKPGFDKANNSNDDEEHEDSDGELFRPVDHKKASSLIDSSRGLDKVMTSPLDFDNDDILMSLKKRFITGSVGNDGEEECGSDDDENGFEDLEAGSDQQESASGESDKEDEDEDLELAKKKEELKLKFDEEYDNKELDAKKGEVNLYDQAKEEMQKQALMNQETFEGEDISVRHQISGYQPGEYVRIILKEVPAEFIENFSSEYPIVLGGLKPSEEQMGFLKVRIKRHRWHKKILKCSDPLIFSLGWRRFQSMPLYFMNDGSRNRMLKYTPEHMHCLATFFGPVTPQNTGFCCVQNVRDAKSHFRICATGVVLESDQNMEVVKKLKLTGTPLEVHKNTAFIKDMFTSALEVAKFEGAGLRTVSGIRGIIKKAHKNPEGSFRATFEDKILMSDIVFLRCWYPVKPKRYCNLVTNMLLSGEKKWTGVRTVSEIRKAEKKEIPFNSDSVYKSIEDRPEKRVFNPLKIPKSILKELPYSTKPKLDRKRSSKKPTYMQKRAVIMETKEREIFKMFQKINTIRNEKEKVNAKAVDKKKKERARKLEKESKIKQEKLKEVKKGVYKKLGKQEAAEKRKADMADSAFNVKRARH